MASHQFYPIMNHHRIRNKLKHLINSMLVKLKHKKIFGVLTYRLQVVNTDATSLKQQNLLKPTQIT